MTILPVAAVLPPDLSHGGATSALVVGTSPYGRNRGAFTSVLLVDQP